MRCAHCTHVWIAQPGDEFRLGNPPPFAEEPADGDVMFRDEEAFAPSPEQDTVAESEDEDNTPSAGAAGRAEEIVETGQAMSDPPPEEPEAEAAETAPPAAAEAESAESDAAPAEADPFIAALAEAEAERQGAAESEADPGAVSEQAAADEMTEVPAGPPDAEIADDPRNAEPDRDAVGEFYGEPGEAGAVAESADHAPERIVIGKAKRRSGVSILVAAGWAGLVLTVAALGVFAVNQRVAVVEALPGSAPVFAALGMPVNIRGLDFRDVAYSWENDAGQVVLEVHGDIVNITGREKAVPPLVLALRDDGEKEVYQWEEKVLNEPLSPGASATFAVRVPTPPKSIESVQVRFAKPR